MKTILSLLGLGLMLALAPSSSMAKEAAASKPNIVFILADDLGYGDLGCFGNKVIKTPHLDKLATQGMKLTDFYCPSSVCSPSRAATLTGRNPERIGIYSWIPPESNMHVRDSEVTIPELLKQAGYTTCFVGKYHCNGKFNTGEQPGPGEQGFDYWMATHNNASPNQKAPANFVRNGEELGEIDGYSSQIIADEAIKWMETVKPDQPFAIFIWTHAPHTPLGSADPYIQMYKEKYPDEYKYYANVTEMDAEIGRVLEALKKSGREDNTLVIFSSDNGPAHINHKGAAGTAGPLSERKWSLHEGGIRVPGIVRWPGVTPAGVVNQTPCGLIDLLPTLAQIAGVPVPDDRELDGVSILPVLENKPFTRSKPLYWQKSYKGKPNVALRDGDWKFLAQSEDHQGEFKDFELFNLREDIGETKDLAQANPEMLAKLKAMAKAIHASVQAEAPEWPLPAPRGNITKVTSSSHQPGKEPVYAVDKDTESRWESLFEPNEQWLLLEFKSGTQLKGMNIRWEDAAAKKYTVSVSEDGENWDVVQEVKKNKPGKKAKLMWKKRPVQFLKIDCLEKTSPEYGYSIKEISFK